MNRKPGEAPNGFTVDSQTCFIRAQIPTDTQSMTFPGLVAGFLQAPEHRKAISTMTDHRLVPVYPERTTKTQITDCFEKAGFTAAVLAIDQVERGREIQGI